MDNQKVWFVTGASKGLGLTLVQQLLALGHQVAATSRNTNELVKAVGYGGEALMPLQVNLASEASVAAAINATIQKFGRIDVVVNNAGYGIGGSIEELTNREVLDSFDINVFGTLNVIRKVMPQLRMQQSGHIINIASIAGIAPALGWAVYAAAKHAVIGLTEVLAEDVKPMGIKATVVAPGAFRTSFLTPESLTMAQHPIEAYQEVRASHARYLQMNGAQAGDPAKAAEAMIKLAALPEPPVYLLLGADAYDRAMNKLSLLENTFNEWKDLTQSTNY